MPVGRSPLLACSWPSTMRCSLEGAVFMDGRAARSTAILFIARPQGHGADDRCVVAARGA